MTERFRTYASSRWWMAHGNEEVALAADEAVSDFLERNGSSVLVCSRSASAVISIHARDGRCYMSLYGAPSPMGLSMKGSRLAIGTAFSIDVYQTLLGHTGEAYLLPVSTHLTGAVSIHDVSVEQEGVIFVNTAFSALCTTRADCHFELLWRPNFVVEEGPVDCCHLNGMALANSHFGYVTALGSAPGREGWRALGTDDGVLINTQTDEIFRGLSLPHSPRIVGQEVWLLESGRGTLVAIEPSGHKRVIFESGGVCRGLDTIGETALIGLSAIRRESQSGPILHQRFGDQHESRLILVNTKESVCIGTLTLPNIAEISTVLIAPYPKVSFANRNHREVCSTFICRDSLMR